MITNTIFIPAEEKSKKKNIYSLLRYYVNINTLLFNTALCLIDVGAFLTFNVQLVMLAILRFSTAEHALIMILKFNMKQKDSINIQSLIHRLD